MRSCLINGTTANALDSGHRAIAFGDGLFETAYADNGRIRFWPDHLERLEAGLERLGMAWDRQARGRLEAEIADALTGLEGPVVCKLLLVRGPAGRGYDFDPARQYTDRIVQVFDYRRPPWVRDGADLVVSSVPASANGALAGLKHLNRLDSVLARQDARRTGAQEALLMLADGRLVEGSMSNCFIRRAGRWTTPRLEEAGVDGIIRRRWRRLGTLDEADWPVTELPDAEALLIGNALLGLVPARQLDARPLLQPSPAELADLREAIGLPRD